MTSGGLPTPPTSKPPSRHNSLDSGVMLIDQWRADSSPSQGQIPLTSSRAGTPTPLIVPMPDETKDTRNGGSLAVRAIRSMRSLARIGNWAQLSNPPPARRAKDSNETTSSWEVGEPSVVRSLLRNGGLDGSFRRSRGSNQSSSSQGTNQNRLSAESNHQLGRPAVANRFSSLSTASSLVPVSTYSGDTRSYKTSTDSDPSSHRLSTQTNESAPVATQRISRTPSIRWDDNIETVKAKRQGARERRGGTTVATRKDGSQRSSQRSNEARQRGKLASIFPEVLEPPAVPLKEPAGIHGTPPVPSPASTPARNIRRRPQSEQLLVHTDRPQAVVPDEGGSGKPVIKHLGTLLISYLPAVISILNAATSDLASLINRLDLQATPDTAGFTPGSREPTSCYGTPAKRDDVTKTPSKKSPRESASITSLRPYNRVQDSPSTGESTSNYGPVFSLPDKSTKQDAAPVKNQVPVESEDLEPVFTRGPTISPTPPVLKPSGRSRPNLRVKESKVNMQKSKPSVSIYFSS
jgi:serine/arginine repetitive matrix protein 2